ncbi:ankyrin repeat protein [Colletotrichum chrysophilum]|uniref:Ankyrin repeat protein n=1 Tax=Colletotrichum chrysophilum TaxID=1836956 RepID=A0AAD9ENQ3_9PEZI|nr:ankyrin repeat protein [Colletotrichum chrysophilum]
MGTVSSASAMASFRSSYTELKLALLVGICGGVPNPGTEKEVLLGDVIISKTVVQYDFGRQNPHRFTTKDTLDDSLGRPNKDIRSLLASLETERTFERLERRTAEILTGIQQTAAQAGRKRTRYPYPGAAQDGLFSPNYEHRHRDDADCGCDHTWICDTAPDASCIELECDKTHLVLRESLEIKKQLEREGNTAEAQEPHILIGRVGSGNAVMKSGAHRDEIAQRYNLIAFEMEAARAWDEVPCVVVKGVCDYADSHKNKKWQAFAAATAASSMKALLELSEVFEGTGKWLLDHETFQSWKNSEASSILWLHGIPGSSKSKLARELIQKLLESYRGQPITLVIDALDECDKDTRQNLLDALVSLLEAPTTLKVFATSRDDWDIVKELDKYQNLYLSSDRNSGDINLFVRSETERLVERGSLLWGSTRKEELRDKIIHELISNAHGMFRWASLHIQELCRQATDAAIEERLVKMPRTLEGLYREILAKNIKYSLLERFEDVLSYPPSVVLVICKFDLSGVLSQERWRALVRARPRSLEGATHKELAIRYGSVRVIQWNLETGTPFELSAKDVEIAAESKPDGVRMILFLLGFQGDVSITEDVLKSAASNKECGDTILEHLVSKRGSEITITEAIVKAAIQNTRKAVSILSLLFENFNSEIRITGDIVVAAIHSSTEEILELLLDARGDEVEISADVILTAARDHEGIYSLRGCFKPVLSFLLGVRRDQIHITEDFIISIAPNEACDEEVMEILLNECEDNLQVTGKLINAVRENVDDGDKLMTLLLDRFEIKMESLDESMEILVHEFSDVTIKITPEIIEELLEKDCLGFVAFELLLDERGHEISITDELVRKAVQAQAPDYIEVLFDKRGDEIQITDDIMKSCSRAETIMTILKKRGGHGIQITENVLIQAAKQPNGIYGKDGGLLQFLLDERLEEVRLTEDFVSAAAGNGSYGFQFITLLNERCGDDLFITNKILRAAASNQHTGDQVIAALLDWHGGSIRITESVVEAAVQSRGVGHKVLAVLFAARGDSIPITEQVLILAVQNEFCGDKIIETIMHSRGDSVEITEEIISAAVQNTYSGHRVLKILLDRYEDDVPVTDDVVRLAASNDRRGDKIVEILLKKRRRDIRVTREIFKAAAHNPNCGHRVIATILDNRDGVDDEDGEVSVALQKAIYIASSKGIGDTVQVLLKNKADVNVEGGWLGNALHAASINAQGGLYNTALQAASAHGYEEIVQFLLQSNADVNAQGGIYSTALYAASFEGHYGIVQILVQNNADVNIPGGVFGNALQAASSEGHLKIAQLLLENGGDPSWDTGFYGSSLQAASAGGHTELVSFLYDEYNVDLNCSNGSFARTALSYAASGGNSSVVQLLLTYADVSPFSEDGISRTPLFYAAQNGHAEIVRILAERNPLAVDRKDLYGSTPLSVAARRGHIVVAKILLAAYAMTSA